MLTRPAKVTHEQSDSNICMLPPVTVSGSLFMCSEDMCFLTPGWFWIFLNIYCYLSFALQFDVSCQILKAFTFCGLPPITLPIFFLFPLFLIVLPHPDSFRLVIVSLLLLILYLYKSFHIPLCAFIHASIHVFTLCIPSVPLYFWTFHIFWFCFAHLDQHSCELSCEWNLLKKPPLLLLCEQTSHTLCSGRRDHSPTHATSGKLWLSELGLQVSLNLARLIQKEATGSNIKLKIISVPQGSHFGRPRVSSVWSSSLLTTVEGSKHHSVIVE